MWENNKGKERQGKESEHIEKLRPLTCRDVYLESWLFSWEGTSKSGVIRWFDDLHVRQHYHHQHHHRHHRHHRKSRIFLIHKGYRFSILFIITRQTFISTTFSPQSLSAASQYPTSRSPNSYNILLPTLFDLYNRLLCLTSTYVWFCRRNRQQEHRMIAHNDSR